MHLTPAKVEALIENLSYVNEKAFASDHELTTALNGECLGNYKPLAIILVSSRTGVADN